ncbi:MAG: Holliday junction branch migration protein RuvA [Deferribacteraceae bacterium]|jgi:Holliday junction DNA helicase RuvA|nr:Holliday junction branch migration protein RuvA [Deferribacteraceae bacterium]
MIYKVTGTIIAKDGGKVAIDMGGIAFEVLLSMNSYADMPELGGKAELFTHFVMREDLVALYGFTTMAEKELFLQLITVSKIGPKLALAILGNIGGEEFFTAVSSQDVNRLSRVPGIGRKTAERIIVELKDKLKVSDMSMAKSARPRSVKEDVVSALCNLGYKQADCEKIVHSLAEDEFQPLLRRSLALLS